MVIDFSHSSESEIAFANRYEPGAINLDDELVESIGAIEISGAARRNEAFARVNGNLHGAVKINCYRCLQAVDVELQIDFAVEYVTLAGYEQATFAPNHERGLTEADFAVSIYDGERIDLDELTREQILLNLPAQTLCQTACAGLCENCGQNKNSSDCKCNHENIDPRWNALKNLGK